MSMELTIQAWEIDCDSDFKLALLWMSEDSSGDGVHEWWRWSPERLADRTGIPRRFISKLLGALMEEGILIYDPKVSQYWGEPYYLIDPSPWLEPVAEEAEDLPATTGAGGVYAKQKIPNALRREVYERDAYRCQHCDEWHDLSVDHIIAESNGGPTTLDNLQTLCRSCNSRKGTK